MKKRHPDSLVSTTMKVESHSKKLNAMFRYAPNNARVSNVKNNLGKSSGLSLKERQIASQVREFAYSTSALSKASFEDPYRRDVLRTVANTLC